MANAERLKAVREAVLNNPEEWDQSNWAQATACGTRLCFAGWACKLAGREVQFTKPGEDLGRQIEEWGVVTTGLLKPTPEELAANLEGCTFISSFAAEWLGLDAFQESDLFYSMDNDEGMRVLDRLIAESE